MTARWGSPSLISRVHVTKARSCNWQRWNMSTISWITDYLTGRLQYVRLPVLLMGSTGAPQGAVLSPGHATYRNTLTDCGVDGSISDEQEEEYRAQVDDFVESSGRNHLLLNANKNRAMVFDFRTKRHVPWQTRVKMLMWWTWWWEAEFEDWHRGCEKKWMSCLFFLWNWNPSMCARGFLSLSCSEHIVLCCVLQGEAASELETPADWITWRGRQALWFLANWTLLKLRWRGGHWKN